MIFPNVLHADSELFEDRYEVLAKHRVRLCREFRRSFPPAGQSEISVYGCAWAFLSADLRELEVQVRHRGGCLRLTGLLGGFIPAFSIIEWLSIPSGFRYELFISDEPSPLPEADRAIVFPTERHERPGSPAEVSAILAGASRIQPIDRHEKSSAVARRAKERITRTYLQNVPLATIAAQLRCHPVVFAREFKACYGLTPVDFRAQLRVTHAWWQLLTQSEPVARIAREAGFRDLSQFNRQFRRKRLFTPREIH